MHIIHNIKKLSYQLCASSSAKLITYANRVGYFLHVAIRNKEFFFHYANGSYLHQKCNFFSFSIETLINSIPNRHKIFIILLGIKNASICIIC